MAFGGSRFKFLREIYDSSKKVVVCRIDGFHPVQSLQILDTNELMWFMDEKYEELVSRVVSASPLAPSTFFPS